MSSAAAHAASQLNMPIDDLLILQLAKTELLKAVARGEVDLNALAREELAARGMNSVG